MVLVPSWDGNQLKTGWWVNFPSMAISTFSSGKWSFDGDEVLVRVNFVLGICCQFTMLISRKLLFGNYIVLPLI